MWKTSTEISNEIFHPLKTWVEKSNGNWNIILSSGFILLLVGMIMLYVFSKRVGEDDERTTPIYLKSSYIMLLTIIFLDLLFPKEYMWQIFFLFKYSLAFIASGIYLSIQYKKDFR